MKEATSRSFPPHGIKLTGIDQRAYLDPEYVGVDWISGFFPFTTGIVQRPAGITKLVPINSPQSVMLGTQRILAIHQTFNSNDLILVQTDSAIYSMTLDELMNRSASTNLVGLPEDYQESMPKAIIVHKVSPSASVGGIVAANTEYQAPLTDIVSQTNPDGTSASFITSLSSSKITLPAGSYRIEGWSMFSAGSACEARLRWWNDTTGTALFAGLANEYFRGFTSGATQNGMVFFEGDFTISGATTIYIKQAHSVADNTNGFGRNTGGAGFTTVAEIYRKITIYKTA